MNFAVLLLMFAPSSLVAIGVWWREPRLWWACLGILATTTGVVLYLPVRNAFHTPSELDDGFGRLGIMVEFVGFVGFAMFVHLGLLVAISMMLDEKKREPVKAAIRTESQ